MVTWATNVGYSVLLVRGLDDRCGNAAHHGNDMCSRGQRGALQDSGFWLHSQGAGSLVKYSRDLWQVRDARG